VRAPGAAAADHDDTVVPSHSYKFVAALQHVLAGYSNSPQRNPLILRIAHNTGHGAGAHFAAWALAALPVWVELRVLHACAASSRAIAPHGHAPDHTPLSVHHVAYVALVLLLFG